MWQTHTVPYATNLFGWVVTVHMHVRVGCYRTHACGKRRPATPQQAEPNITTYVSSRWARNTGHHATRAQICCTSHHATRAFHDRVDHFDFAAFRFALGPTPFAQVLHRQLRRVALRAVGLKKEKAEIKRIRTHYGQTYFELSASKGIGRIASNTPVGDINRHRVVVSCKTIGMVRCGTVWYGRRL